MQEDKLNGVYWILFLQGIGALLPWNVFITAGAYFHERFQNTAFHDSFLNYFAISFNCSTLMTMLVTTTVLRKHLPSINSRIICPLLLSAAIVFLSGILVKTPSISGNAVFEISIFSTIFSAIFSAFYQDGILGITAAFPEKYTQAFMAGQALAGFVVAMSNFIITATQPPSVKNSTMDISPLWGAQLPLNIIDTCAFAYFMLAFCVLILCLITFFIFLKLPFTRYYRERSDKNNQMLTAAFDDIDDSTSKLLEAPERDGHLDIIKPSDRTNMASQNGHYIFDIVSRIKFQAFAVFFNFLVTLALFPYPISSIKSSTKSEARIFNDLFVPFIFVLFSFGDFVGRVVAGFWNMKNAKNLAIFSFSRCIFVVLFLLCNIEESGKIVTVSIFRSDFFPAVFIILCSISNGYIASVAMMNGSSSLTRKYQELGGSLMFFALCFGLTCGSLLSFVIRASLCHCNPF